MTELETLIAEQARDMAARGCGSISLDRLDDGVYIRPRGRATDDRHGTENLYQHGPCRCSRCRTAHAAYRQERRRNGKEAWE